MRKYDFSEPKFMKKVQEALHNYDKSCQSKLALKFFFQSKATSNDFYLKVYPLKTETLRKLTPSH